ncbi:hypothetical protein ENSA5_13680 [Enhygromyxa salina]|uniref:Uncharacterized protein n=1 Tax=Enhygromyxa salina TaxID=215803 RepID=A0A2S9YEZ0_9BACT|nr:hypothetical protein [Enhygromyxa salina]PRQ03675.1 hypothetical protein ENSA5_13680 [Enhygromyxa salina]
MSPPPISYIAALISGFLLSACSAFFVPDFEDDGVHRCDLTSDCPELEDNRYVAVCVLPEQLSAGAAKICSSDYDTVPCAATAYGPNHPLTRAYADAFNDPARYGVCPTELLGSSGCGPSPDGCEAGLVLNVYGTCIDPEVDPNAIGAGQLPLEDVLGQDVKDQFCRSYFCDERFVCSHRGSQPRCVPCDPDRYFSRAGCGTLYVQGEVSSVYLDVEATGNCAGDLPTNEIQIGRL